MIRASAAAGLFMVVCTLSANAAVAAQEAAISPPTIATPSADGKQLPPAANSTIEPAAPPASSPATPTTTPAITPPPGASPASGPAPTQAPSPSPAVAGPMTTAPVTIPAATPTSFAGSFQVMFGMFAILALLFGVTWMLKKYGPIRTGAGSAVKIIGGVSVGNRERIVVVEVADQWIVVGVAPGRVSALSTLPKQDGVVSAETAIPEKNFSTWLKQTIDKRNGN